MANKALGFPFGFFANDNTPLDAKYFNRNTLTPYASTADVLSLLPAGIRYQGLTVNIAGVEYHFKNGIADADLIIKETDVSGKADITYVDEQLSLKVDKVEGKQLSTEDYTTAEKTKLAGIEDGANNYVHPVNHPPSIITQDVNNRFVTDAQIAVWNAKQAALGFTPENAANKNTANGYAGLDSGAKLPVSLFPDAVLGNVKYGGTYNGVTVTASSWFPELDGQALPASSSYPGVYFIATTSFTEGSTNYATGDWIISNGTSYGKVDNSDAVTTVFGRLGNIVANVGDYNTDQVTEASNLYYTDARVKAYADTLYLPIGGTAVNSDKWGNVSLTGGNITTPTYIAAFNNTLDNAGYVSITQLKSTIGLGSAAYVEANQNLRTYDSPWFQGLNINGVAESYREIPFRTNNSLRWDMFVVGAETGSNTGSNFYLVNYDDAGNGLSNVITIPRATGVVNFDKTPTVGANPVWHTGNLIPDTGAVANTVVKRNVDGYVQAAFFQNTNTNLLGVGNGIDRLYGGIGSDGYLRQVDISGVREFLGMPSGGETLQSVALRDGTLNTPITLGANGYFLGTAVQGTRFNDSQSLYNNFIIYENGNTYTRGNVGIGTTNPQSYLSITPDGSNTIEFFPGNSSTYGSYIQAYNRATDNFDRLGFRASSYVFTDGNVLIGTTTDSGYKLDIVGDTRVTGALSVTQRILTPSGIALDGANTDNWIIKKNGSVVEFWLAGVLSMKLDSTGLKLKTGLQFYPDNF